jgi:ubiquinone/menaquinone biosynthesis C-methylase UbiE
MTATTEQIQRAWHDPKLANVIYHDWEASTYDDKWSISYDERCVKYAAERFEHAAGPVERPFGRSLEIGGGTGFFTLNLMLGKVIERGDITDLSPKMVEVALRNGTSLGLDVAGLPADAEALPYDDDTFDLVCGHAVLHHIPDLDLAMREVLRVLKPGGTFVFAGEPSRHGDLIARKLSNLTWDVTKRLMRLPVVKDRYGVPDEQLQQLEHEAHLEAVVDLHTFDPDELARLCLRAGAIDVRTVTDEFTASWFGWPVRTVEAAVRPGSLGFKWYQFAYRGWIGLNWLDGHVWSAVVPDRFFYNVSVSGTKPPRSPSAPSRSPSGAPSRAERGVEG